MIRLFEAGLSVARNGSNPYSAAERCVTDCGLSVNDRLPGFRLDPDCPNKPRGHVFRKPPALPVQWTA
jgi:hypothetical protein